MRAYRWMMLSLIALGALVVGTSRDPVRAQPPAPKAKKLALLVGVNQYDHAKLSDLKFAERDATELADVLKKAGFETRVLLASGEKKDRATVSNARQAIKDVADGLTKRDLLVVLLSGQGLTLALKDREDAFFCLRDSNPAKPETMLGVSEVLGTMNESGAGTALLLVDACRDISDPNRGVGRQLDTVGLRPGVAALLACSRGQKSYESADLKHGVFTHAVLTGLRGRAADKSGVVTLDALAAHVRQMVPATCAKVINGDIEQHPHLIANLAGPPVVLIPGD
ncbi:MAG: caspase family protein [Gemmataceae bacterium]|nr:caspase family protein [Gemmataceae bacterium]